MVFERFVSEARNEPPDIDVDFEHERREEVIQHIYDRYGRHRAGSVRHGRCTIAENGRCARWGAPWASAKIPFQALSSPDLGVGLRYERELELDRMREIGLDPRRPASARRPWR